LIWSALCCSIKAIRGPVQVVAGAPHAERYFTNHKDGKRIKGSRPPIEIYIPALGYFSGPLTFRSEEALYESAGLYLDQNGRPQHCETDYILLAKCKFPHHLHLLYLSPLGIIPNLEEGVFIIIIYDNVIFLIRISSMGSHIGSGDMQP
jgi:hypothetical protein